MEEFEKPIYSFITGRAGTGKSYKLQQIAKEEQGTALTSTTGISAVNVAGTTLHSLLWFYSTESLLDSWTTGKLDYRLGELYGKFGLRHLLTDEVSMLSRTALSVICAAIDRLNEMS